MDIWSSSPLISFKLVIGWYIDALYLYYSLILANQILVHFLSYEHKLLLISLIVAVVHVF